MDLHLVHEVTSPQAFEGLRLAGRRVRRPDLTVATVDHNVPTGDRRLPIADQISARQVAALVRNAREFGVELFDLDSPEQGIVHVIGPELGLTQPGMIIVCGDSHTSTHGAFGALAFGIGTSEVEHVLATQCIVQSRPRTMEVRFAGLPEAGVTAKDLVLAADPPDRDRRRHRARHRVHRRGHPGPLHGGPDDGLQHVDRGRRPGRDGGPGRHHRGLPARAGPGPQAGRTGTVSAPPGSRSTPIRPPASTPRSRSTPPHLGPQVTWGTSPGMTADITERVPDPADQSSDADRQSFARALEYMGLEPGTPLEGLKVDRVFLGSCTNARIEDLREAAKMALGRKVADSVRAMVVPGSQLVKAQAEREGLDRIFTDAGFEWRNPGCSMCLGMNEDILGPGERCASTSNRNFEGRQGRGGRTHLVSPVMAVAAAVEGCLVDVRSYMRG